MNPLLMIAIVVCIVAFGSKAFLRRLGILLMTGAKIAVAAVLVALLSQCVVWVRTLEMSDCRPGQKYVAELDVCEGAVISQKDLTEVLLSLPDNATDEDISKAVAEHQTPTRLDRLWSQVLDWNRRRKQPVAQRPGPMAQKTPIPLSPPISLHGRHDNIHS